METEGVKVETGSQWRETLTEYMGKQGEAYEKNRTRNYNRKPKQREIKGSLSEVLQYWN